MVTAHLLNNKFNLKSILLVTDNFQTIKKGKNHNVLKKLNKTLLLRAILCFIGKIQSSYFLVHTLGDRGLLEKRFLILG